MGESGADPFIWPVGYEDVYRARDHFLALMGGFLTQERIDEDRDAEILWLLMPELALDFIRLFIGCALTEKLKASGLSPKYGENGRLFELIANDRWPQPLYGLQYILRGIPEMPLWRRIGRNVAGPFRRDGFKRKPVWRIDREGDALTFASTPMHVDHATGMGQELVLGTYNDWFEAGAPLERAPAEVLSQSTYDKYQSIVREAFDAGGVNFPPFLEKFLLRQLNEAARCIRVHMDSVERKSAMLPALFWSGTAGSIFNRLFGRAIHKNGGSVLAFDHGTGSGWWRYNCLSAFELNYCDEFVTYTKAMADGVKRNEDIGVGATGCHDTSIVPIRRPARPQRSIKSYARKKTGTLLYVSTVYIGEAVCSVMPLADMVYVDFQARMLQTLVSEGYKVNIRPHPDSFASIPPKYREKFGTQEVNGNFYDAIEEGDVLIFDYMLTTALRDAMYTDKPIILIEYGHSEIYEEARRLLEKRVRIVPASKGADNRINIDWGVLLEAVNEAHALLDHDFVSTYYGL